MQNAPDTIKDINQLYFIAALLWLGGSIFFFIAAYKTNKHTQLHISDAAPCDPCSPCDTFTSCGSFTGR